MRRVTHNAAYFWQAVDKADGCWLWTRRTVHGYGVYWDGKRSWQAHRYAWLLTHGDEPAKGLHLDHLCRVRNCVRPEHLEPVTPAENARRGHSPVALKRDRTACNKGHLLAGDNLHIYNGLRVCKTCANERSRAHRQRHYDRLRQIREEQGIYMRPKRGTEVYMCKNGNIVTNENARWHAGGRACSECVRQTSLVRNRNIS